jgi:type IV secretory pathway VirB10-like protein
MADEEVMRELLADPVVRRELAAVLAKGAGQRAGWWQRLFKPGPMAAFSAGVLAVVAFVVIRPETAKQRAEQAIVAEVPAGSAGNAPAKDTAQPEMFAVESDRRADKQITQSKPVLMARKEKDQAPGLRDYKAAEPAPAAPPPPPPPPPLAVAQPASQTVQNEQTKAEQVQLAPAQMASGSLGEAKRAAAAAPAPPPPFRYRVQRLQQPGGEWVEFGGELTPGTQARLAIETMQSGVLIVRSGRDVLSVDVQPGQMVHFPGSGSFPAEAGEREVAVLFQPIPGSLASPMQSVGGFRAKAAPARASTARQQGQMAADAVAGAGPSTEYSVTVRLRYR